MEVASLGLPVDDPTRVGEARREAASLAHRLGFSEDDESRVSIVATELTTNLQRHARGERWFLARGIVNGAHAEIELIATDSGPGIENISDAERDGFSTAGGAGGGMGAMRRLADALDVHTAPNGTTVLARLFRDRAGAGDERLGAVRVAKRGEERCGDAWAAEVREDGAMILLADGLGHGWDAAEAANAAVAAFHEAEGRPLLQRLTAIHEALTGTRGAAVALASIDFAAGMLTYGGLGNISGVIVRPGEARNLVSLHGTAGKAAPRMGEFAYPWARDATLIMHSDGVSAHWDMSRYPGLLRCHPSVIAAVLFRDHTRGRDDSCITVFRETAPR